MIWIFFSTIYFKLDIYDCYFMMDFLQWMSYNGYFMIDISYGYFVQTSYKRFSMILSFAWELVDLGKNNVGRDVVCRMAADHFQTS